MRRWAVPAAVAAIAVAAVVDAVRGGSATGAEPVPPEARAAAPSRGESLLGGPGAPPAGALPGALLVSTADGCRLRIVDFTGPSLGAPGPPTACAVWVPPAGRFVAASLPGEPGSGEVRLGLVRLRDPPELTRVFGEIRGEASWSPDGVRLAWCTGTGETVVHSVEDGTDRHVDGCRPRFTPQGSLLTTAAEPLSAGLLRDGRLELGPDELVRGFEPRGRGDLDVLAFDEAPGGLLAVSVLRLEPLGSRAVLELWQDGELLAGAELPRRFGPGPHRFGELVRFSPNGALLAVGASPRSAGVVFVDLRLRRPLLRLDDHRGFSWSPDGAWLAVALDREIVLYGTNDGQPVYRLPLAADGIAWLPSVPAGRAG